MIEFVPRNGSPEAINCPAFVCDACRKQIAGEGNIVWALKVRDSETETAEQSPLYAAHKGACDQALEAWLMSQYDSQWVPLWEEIGTFLKQLVHNTGRDFSQDSKGQYQQLVIRHPASNPHSQVP
ncbi:hypothetical protein [Streptomyces sp. NPDC096030]|uniref:hypothetical protein n=1 Tax=Streptomyces sp. NPDC096030 TaxID=3155423 RepID=UPI003326B7B6